MNLEAVRDVEGICFRSASTYARCRGIRLESLWKSYENTEP